jgi:AmmeMemoRadiSam system protein A
MEMKLEKDDKCLCFLCLFSLFLLILLWVQFPITGSARGDQIRSKAVGGLTSTASHGERGKKEGDMTAKDKLSDEEGKKLLAVARRTIEQKLLHQEEAPKGADTDIPVIFREHRGTFVTLTKGGNLRGCIGHIIPQESLIEGIRINALNAAFRDPRFQPLTREEWGKVQIEISILTDPEPLPYSDAEDLLKKIRTGIDGVIIKKGYHQATFLPQVWEQLPKKEEFLTHLCLKAGLEGNAWKKQALEVSTYQVQAFEE